MYSQSLLCIVSHYYVVKTCGKAENNEAKGVPGRRGVMEGDRTM